MNDKIQNGLIIVGIIVFIGMFIAIYHFGINWITSYLKRIVFTSTWLVSPLWIAMEICAGLGLFCYFIYRQILWKYNPRGYQPSSTHSWVDPETGQQVMSASEKDVYEHFYGAGSWETKVGSERKGLVYIGGCVSFFFPLIMMLINKSHFHLVLGGALVGLSFFVIVAMLHKLYDAANFSQVTTKECLLESIFIWLLTIAVFAVFPIISAMICFFHPYPLPNWSVQLQLWCHFLFFGICILSLIIIPIYMLFLKG